MDPISKVIPGKQLTDKEKEDLAKSNAEATAEAHRQAAEHRAADARGLPTTERQIADSIKSKLEREEFQKKAE